MAESEATEQTMGTNEALRRTDRNLRRITKLLREQESSGGEELQTAVQRARRQLRINRQLLGGPTKDDESSDDEASADEGSGEEA